MKLKHSINLHKALTAFVVVGMMFFFGNFSTASWIYLGLHGSYGFLWLFKDLTYPDKQWEKRVSIPYGFVVFIALGLYWLPPFLLISQNAEPNEFIIVSAIALNMIGMVLHFGSDAQKYYTLKHKSGLITDGYFARSRNTNYLGELMIYVGFAMLSMNWMGYIGIFLFFSTTFIPNMLKKDTSLSRYPEFADYKKRSGLLFPKFW